MKKNTKVLAVGWMVMNKDRGVTTFQFGDPLLRIVFHPSKKQALEAAQRHAEREDELACGDINRWDMADMPHEQVRRMGYRVVSASVVMPARKT